MNNLEFKKLLKKHKFTIVLSGIILLATLLRFYEITRLSFWADEIISARETSNDMNALIALILDKSLNMSLFNFLLWFFVHILPDSSKEILRVFPAFFSVVSIPVVYALGRIVAFDKARSNLIGLTAAFFLAINAFHIEYGQELRSYSLTFLLTSLSTYLLIKAIEKPDNRKKWIGYAVVSIAGIFSHFYSLFILLAQLISIIPFLWNKKNKLAYKGLYISFVSILLLLVPLVFLGYQQRNTYFNWIPFPSSDLIFSFLIQVTGSQGFLLLVLYVVLVIVGLIDQTKKLKKNRNEFNKWKLQLMVLCLVMPVTMSFLISIFITPIFWNRYLLFVVPYLSILGAFGFSSMINLRKNSIRNYLSVLVLILFTYLSLTGVRNYFSYYKKEDIRGVAKFISKNCINDFRLYYPFKYMVAVPYYDSDIKSQVSRPGQNDKDAFAKFLVELDKKSQQYKRTCFVVSTAPFQYNPSRNEYVALLSFFNNKYSEKKQETFYRFSIFIYNR